MKIKPGFILRTVDDMSIVVAVGEASRHFNGMITLNETGAVLWKQLENGCDEDALVSALCSAFTVDEQTAREDARAFTEAAFAAGFLDE